MIHDGVAVSDVERERRKRDATIIGLCLAAGVAAGLLAGILVQTHEVLLLPGVLVLLLPVVAWRRMPLAVAGLALICILVEQYPIPITSGDFTDHLPLFTSLSDYFGLSGLYANPFEVLLAVALLVVVARARQVTVRWPRNRLSFAMAAVLGLVLVGAVHGVMAGGDYKWALWEIRPTLYVAAMYFLAAQLPARVEILSMTLWVFVAGVAFKAFQGLLLVPQYVAASPTPDYLLSHEDSFFFALFIALVGALWLFKQKGRLRTVSTWLLPLVLLVNMLNNRRTSWAILGLAIFALAVLVWVRLPERRRLIAGVGATVAIMGAVYLPVYWNQTGLLARPAEALRSQVTPDARDQSSDLYRVQENANLVLNIHRSPLVGLGFGVPIDYALPINDLPQDPSFKYIPHNGVLWLWMRLGAVGALVFWSMVGFACVSACRLLRTDDPRLKVFGAFVVCALVGWVILAYFDLGFIWFRVAICIGWLLGVLEVGHLVRAQQKESEPDSAVPNHRGRRKLSGARRNLSRAAP